MAATFAGRGWRRTVLALAVSSLLHPSSLVCAQSCFYPNGGPADDADTPCTSENADLHLGTSTAGDGFNTCCPENWACLQNGLCQNPASEDPPQSNHVGQGMYGRYSCTSSDFTGCTDVCNTFGAGGAEALLECFPDQWCCDRDRTSGNCCLPDDQGGIEDTPLLRFQGTNVVTLGAAETGGGSSVPPPPSSAPPPSSFPTSSPPPVTTPPESDGGGQGGNGGGGGGGGGVRTSTGTNAAGSVSTVIITMTPTAAPSGSDSSSSDDSNLGLIVGCAVGIPLGVILIAGIAFLVWRRKRKSNVDRAGSSSYRGQSMEDDGQPDNMLYAAPWMKKTGTEWNPSEADGLPIGAGAGKLEKEKNDPSAKAELQGDQPSEHRSPATDVSPATATTTGQSPVPPREHADGAIIGKGEQPIHEMPTEKYND